PFNIANDGPNLLVTYALQNGAKHDDVAGAHHGFIDLYSTGGTLLRRFAARGTLNSPWGVTIAPHSFGKFADDILVGNFGDGMISAFDRKGHFQGLVSDAAGNPFAIDGL